MSWCLAVLIQLVMVIEENRLQWCLAVLIKLPLMDDQVVGGNGKHYLRVERKSSLSTTNLSHIFSGSNSINSRCMHANYCAIVKGLLLLLIHSSFYSLALV